jgi:hypothetical protein
MHPTTDKRESDQKAVMEGLKLQKVYRIKTFKGLMRNGIGKSLFNYLDFGVNVKVPSSSVSVVEDPELQIVLIIGTSGSGVENHRANHTIIASQQV